MLKLVCGTTSTLENFEKHISSLQKCVLKTIINPIATQLVGQILLWNNSTCKTGISRVIVTAIIGNCCREAKIEARRHGRIEESNAVINIFLMLFWIVVICTM